MSKGVDRLCDQEVAHCVSLPIRTRADAVTFAAVVRDLVSRHGGTRRQAAEAATAAAEMVQNIVTHGGASGDASVWFEGDLLYVRAQDRGPGLPDPEALLVGSAARRARGLPGGLGLGEGGAALARLMDRVIVGPNDERGLVVLACKRVSREGVFTS